MQPLNIEKEDQLFRYLGRSPRNLYTFAQTTDSDNPYMLDAINEIGSVFSVYGRIFQGGAFSRLKQAAGYDRYDIDEEAIPNKSEFLGLGTGNGQGRLRMVRVSVCEYFVARVYESSILIQRCGSFFQSPFCELDKLDIKIEEKIEFRLSEGRYSYLEWSPLNHAYSEKPSFLTLDDKGRLRIHYLKEETEQMIEVGEIFCCATFSFGGSYIYAINEEHELCKIDLQGLNLITKRSIGILSNPEGVMSSHIKQITPQTFAIGSVIKTTDDEGANLKPYLFLVSGNISDQDEELKIKAFEMPLIEKFDIRNPVIFRTMYLKGRQLLLFGHSGSNEFQVLPFAENESERKVFLISLGNRTLRGVIFMKERIPNELQHEYQNKKLELFHCPKLMIMDSEGDIHHYRYFDQRSCVPTLSLFIRPRSIEEFVKRQGRLRGWLDRKKNRCKSQDSKIEITSVAQTSKTDCSIQYLPSEIKISSSRKEKIIEALKESHLKFKSPRKTEDKPVQSDLFSTNLKDKPIFNSLFSAKTEDSKSTTNNLFSSKAADKSTTSSLFSGKTENSKSTTNNLFSSKEEKSTTSSLFSAKTESQPTTSNLFSSKAADKSVTSSLFSAKTESQPTTSNLLSEMAPSFSFKKFEEIKEPQNSLFGPAPVLTNKIQPRSGTSYAFSEKTQNTTSQIFPEDPIKKEALVFLNKLESDVIFKVEDQEFPAHKSILSEKCRFFKNMFSSGMYESSASVIEISDTKASMFKGFLEYVYLGKVAMNEELAMGLFEFSEKYMIDGLKESCENFLVYWITLKNWIKMYETACFYEADSLKGKILLFLEAHINEITAGKDFEDLPKSTYVLLRRIQFNNKMIFDPSFAQFMNSYRQSGSERSGVKNFLG